MGGGPPQKAVPTKPQQNGIVRTWGSAVLNPYKGEMAT